MAEAERIKQNAEAGAAAGVAGSDTKGAAGGATRGVAGGVAGGATRGMAGGVAGGATGGVAGSAAGSTEASAEEKTEKVTSVRVKILDKEYQINCPLSEKDALLKSARYLDENMKKIKSGSSIQGIEKIAVMAALNITNDMLSKNRVINEQRLDTLQKVQGLSDKIDAALKS
ncbi:MAG: cell division protein ZapA [Pseudohongiellaceae bacterium]